MCCALFELYEIYIVLPATRDVRQFRSRNCPQYFGTGPNDQGGTRHGGSAAWISRTSVIVGRISRTLVSDSSLSNMNPRWWSNIFLSLWGFFSGGLGTTRRRRVNQGLDTSSRPLTGTGARHVTSLPSDRSAIHHVVAAYQGTHLLCGYLSAGFSPHRFGPMFLFRRLGFFSFSITVFVTAHTLTHLHPGPSGVTGFMGSLLDLMRRNWG